MGRRSGMFGEPRSRIGQAAAPASGTRLSVGEASHVSTIPIPVAAFFFASPIGLPGTYAPPGPPFAGLYSKSS